MKKTTLLIVLSVIVQTSNAQVTWGVKAGFGTSWIAFPKVYLVDTVDATLTNVWEIAPATNSGTFYFGGEAIIKLNEHLGFRAELSYTYTSGEVNVSEVDASTQARKLQAYHRIEVPLLFTVKSDDSFWFSLGPSIFFNAGDNKGFEEAVAELAPNAKVDASVPWGIRARLAANMKLSEHLYLEVKFDYDLGKHFEYIDDVYDVRMAMQGVSGGLTYLF